MLRRTLITALTTTTVAVVASPAWADPGDPDFDGGNATCDASGCEVDAGSRESIPGSPAPVPEGSAGGSGEEANPGCDVAGGDFECPGVIPGFDDGGDAVDPVEIANQARDSLTPPVPDIGTSPGAETPVLVQVPVWLWLPEDEWAPVSAEAAVPGGSIEVVATPTQAEWGMGDGTSVSCDGPGVAFDPEVHDPAAESPACGHTYTRAGEVSLGVDVVWSVTWSSSDGAGGELDDLVTSDSTELSVVESQALID